MARKERLSTGEVLGWTVAGLTTGLVAGVMLTAWFGRGSGRRIRHALDRWRPSRPPVRNIATPARLTQETIDNSPDLRPFRIQVVGVMPGVVELHGWVPTRAIRASAGRIAVKVPGIERVVNCILVRGEDDRSAGPPRKFTDQSA